jgi:hypothetical protein
MQVLMRCTYSLLLIVWSMTTWGQFHKNLVDPVVTVNYGLMPVKIRGIGDPTGIASSSLFIPTDPAYTTIETSGLIGSMMIQLGADLSIIRKEEVRIGLRALGGIGPHFSMRNADGFTGLATEWSAMGFYRRALGNVELSGFAGYKRVWSALSFHFVMIGVELDFDEHWGVMFSGSINQQKYYRIFTNGFEEPAFKIRDLGLTAVFRY